jgi:hypothetical protein
MNIDLMLKNYKLIQFSDGSYGIRRGILSYSYYDFLSSVINRHWWSCSDKWYKTDCRTTKENAMSVLVELTTLPPKETEDYVVCDMPKRNRS